MHKAVGGVVGVALLFGACALASLNFAPLAVRLDTPSAMAVWPWPGARSESLRPGVTHWFAADPDGTSLDLICFDFKANPRLRFEIYNQDEDDDKPFDGLVDYRPMAATQALQHIEAKKPGKVIAIANGIFFGYKVRAEHLAHPVSPMVLNGKTYYTNIPQHRWTFGVQYQQGRPTFKTFFKPNKATMAKAYDFAAGSAQCLINNRHPLKLKPFPRRGERPPEQPVASYPNEAGHIPRFDHMKSSRVALGWTTDSRKLFLLVVKEPDSEMGSIYTLHQRRPPVGGWMVSDVQRFWLALGLPDAVNSDGGDVAQLVYRRPDGKYEMAPPRQGSTHMRQVFDASFKDAPPGGSLSYYYVRELSAPAR